MINIVNKGGKKSIIRLGKTPVLESDTTIPESSFGALEAWKARPGEIITVSDNEGCYYRARLTEWDGHTASAHVFKKYPKNHENTVSITVFQALPEKERFELILQKLTEIGVTSIIPFSSQKSITIEERDSSQKKSHKWPDVILKAAKQSRRGVIPGLSSIITWKDLMDSVLNYSKAIILSEHGDGIPMGKALNGVESESICIITGPEGGFTGREVAEALTRNVIPVSLGSRILRTETASIIGAALAVNETGGFL